VQGLGLEGATAPLFSGNDTLFPPSIVDAVSYSTGLSASGGLEGETGVLFSGNVTLCGLYFIQMPRSLEGFDCEKCHKEGKDHQHLCHIQESSLPHFLANIVERNRILCLFFVQIFFKDEGIYNGCYIA
jgi:hypothetical protein